MIEFILLVLFGVGFVWLGYSWASGRDRERAANRTPSDQAQRQVDQEAELRPLYANSARIMQAAAICEQRRNGRNVRGGPVVVSEIPEDDHLDYDVRVSQKWLRREGPKNNIHLE